MKSATRRQAEDKQQAALNADDAAYKTAPHAVAETTDAHDDLADDAAQIAAGALASLLPHEEAPR